MDKLWNFYQKAIDKISDKPNKESSPQVEEQRRKMPILDFMLRPYNIVFCNFKVYLLIAAVLSAFLTVMAFLLKHPYMCLYQDYRLGHQCQDNVYSYIFMHLLTLGMISVFAVRWYKIVWQQAALNVRYILRLQKDDLKSFATTMVFLFLNMLSLLSGYVLFMRVPNPDWQIEVVYFTLIGLGFVVPFVTMFFYSVPAFIWAGEKLPSIKEVWRRNAGNGGRILLSLALIFLASFFTIILFNGKIRLVPDKNTFYIGIIVEYVYNMLVFLLATFFINHCILQKTYLFGEKK